MLLSDSFPEVTPSAAYSAASVCRMAADQVAATLCSQPARAWLTALCGPCLLPERALRGTLVCSAFLEVSVTQQYIVGQFSVLLADLQLPSGEWLAAVRRLRCEVESCPLSMLPGSRGKRWV